MKINIFILSFLVFIMNTAKGQGYDPVVDNTKSWNVLSGGYCCPVFPIGYRECCYQTSFIRFSDDTIIDGNLFKKVTKSHDSLTIFQTVGYMREIDKRIYFTNLNGYTGLLYDFNINPGDTVKILNTYLLYGAPQSYDTIVRYVSVVDTFEYASINRKRITLVDNHNYSDEKWIEGIGSTYGLLNSCFNLVGGFVDLLCVYQSDNQIYFNTIRNSCYIIDNNTKIPVIENNNVVTVYPNPADKMVLIRGLKITTGSSFTVYDLTGRVVCAKPITGNFIELPDLKANIYFYRIVTLINQINGKLIIK